MAKSNSNPLQRLLQLISLEKDEVKSIYFYAILSGLVQLSVPIGVQAIIGFVLGAAMVTSLFVLIFLVVFGVAMVGVFQINQMKVIEKIQQKIFTRYAFDFSEKIPRFDLKHVDNSYLPETINRFFDALNVQKGFSKLLLDIPTATIQILFGLLLLSFYHPFFIAFGFLLILLLWLILGYTSRKGLITSYKESSYKYAVVSWLEEMARVLKSFKFSQGSHLNVQRTDQNVLGYLHSRTAHFQVLLVQYRTLVAFKVLITAGMLSVGTFLLLDQQINIGEFIAAEIVILTVIAAVEKLISSLDSVYDVITGLEKLATVTETPLEKDGSFILNTENQGIEINFVDFNFQYDNGQKVFTNFNLTILKNKKICIQGKPGAGKSTLLKILSGSYSDFSGQLLLNHIPIGNYKLESLRTQTGIYLNNHDIFIGTLWENISMGRTSVSPEKIMAVANELGIQDFIHTFHSGFDSEIDPMGKRLSSTVIKKILLLRALSNTPKLLLLEEPWRGFDEQTTQRVMNYLLDKTNNCTVVVVTNDEDFGKKCDEQYELS
jgi:ABC-type bacteriocin/lantibiotic exporter with double-glycine peptidase domain